MSQEQRQHERWKHKAKVRVVSQVPNMEMVLFMRDLSDSGMYLLSDETDNIHIGDKMEIQTLEFEDAPVIQSAVVRIETHEGFAVHFI